MARTSALGTIGAPRARARWSGASMRRTSRVAVGGVGRSAHGHGLGPRRPSWTRGPGNALSEMDSETAGAKMDANSLRELFNESIAVIRTVAPPFAQVGTEESRDVLKELDVETLTRSDSVFNPEMSWLAFNWRVLAMAANEDTPIFERLRFVAISARNLDEFFAKRVGAIKRQEEAGVENLVKARGREVWTPNETLRNVAVEVERQVDVQAALLEDHIVPALGEHGVRLEQYDDLEEEVKQKLESYFEAQIEPVLDPRAIDPCHPFPFLGSYSLSIAVELEDAFNQDKFAIVSVPAALDRWVRVPSPKGESTQRFLPLEQLIEANIDKLFRGCSIRATHVFRVTRNADIERNEDQAEDLLEMIADEVRERRFASFVRLEVQDTMPEQVRDELIESLDGITLTDVITVPHRAPLGFGTIDSIPIDFGMDVAMLYSPWSPRTHSALDGKSIFEAISEGDILVHHPYTSFATSTQAFIEEAARDPDVLSIKSTLYRTSDNSPIVRALIKAAENGKQVAVLVELKARFDEARNVGFAERLETAGCNVAYGVKGVKTHSKASLVVRREGKKLVKYVHIGTGNYNPSTAGIYTDFGLLSRDDELGDDVSNLFKFLMGHHYQERFKKLLVAPVRMQKEFVDMIEREAENALRGKPASIIAKMNGLDDPTICAALYRASQAGVKINLIVRGICRVRPGIPGVSENIRVVSIIGRFLEHHRAFRFENNGEPEFYMGSADMMRRNLLRRVEVITRVLDPRIQAELQEVLDACLADQVLAWEMGSDGRYYKTEASREVAANHLASDPGKGKLMKTSAEVGLHEALMDDTLKRMKRVDKRSDLVKLATKKVKQVTPRAPKETFARTLKTNSLEVNQDLVVTDDQSKATQEKRPNFDDMIHADQKENVDSENKRDS
ncbi:Polyphosphate kinase [Ostreococcus tauri]|uniref:ATP-polyphosphate phosphotransferase n=1 Tax=Ostreococcus tauri TaxID=70448 RepID=A0A090M3D0_OSTTA|nr:Polyphosphate kinase [Ostreococcus tauri]CEF96509.1 Polyphosphate kinase [Ostreococcus tauri]|eukprot:XP_003074121.2 Polyphosphate kinase [Ostreococcus tauri]